MSLQSLKYLIIVLLTITVISTSYFAGHRSAQLSCELKTEIINNKIKELEVKQSELTQKVVTEYVYKTKIVKEKGDQIVQYVDQYIPQDTNCVIPNNVIGMLNSAMQNTIPDTTSITDASPSEFTIHSITKNTVQNYGVCNEYREQITGLQDWIKQQSEVR